MPYLDKVLLHEEWVAAITEREAVGIGFAEPPQGFGPAAKGLGLIPRCAISPGRRG